METCNLPFAPLYLDMQIWKGLLNELSVYTSLLSVHTDLSSWQSLLKSSEEGSMC